MKKILNQPADFVPEMLDGLLRAHPDQLDYAGGDVHCIVRAGAPFSGKVALATGGGLVTCPFFWDMSARECWTAVLSAMSLPRRVPNRCWPLHSGSMGALAWSTSTVTTAAM